MEKNIGIQKHAGKDRKIIFQKKTIPNGTIYIANIVFKVEIKKLVTKTARLKLSNSFESCT